MRAISKFQDMDHFLSMREFRDYIGKNAFEKTYIIRYDPEQKKRRKFEYWNVPAAFDIETTSFYLQNGEKAATMYLWGFDFNGRSVYGRTWAEWVDLCEYLHDVLNTEQVRLVVYIHNMPYEIGFMARWFEWSESFCMGDHKMVKGVTTLGIEFRCSLVESGKKLALLSEEITENPVKKLDTLDYRGMRHSETPLTDLELMYQLNDVRVVTNYIYEKGKKRTLGIPKILMTRTGYVRERYRKGTRESPDRNVRTHYKAWMDILTLQMDEYYVLNAAFRGGHTHANALWVGEVLYDVASLDEISAYPAMMTKAYPMGKGHHFDTLPDEKYLDDFCCVFRWEVWNIRRRKGVYDDPLSSSKCSTLEKPLINNGRVKEAEHLVTYLTEVDLKEYRKFYEWDREDISDIWAYHKGYLPKEFLLVMFELYANKTTLKGQHSEDGSIEALYMLSKGDLNASFGCICTKVVKDMVEFIDYEYRIDTEQDPEALIQKYNKDRKRFLFFPWALYITSYAREAVLDAILAVGKDFVYSDTDSVKILNVEKHLAYFTEYNERIRLQHKKCLDFHGLPMDLCEPVTKKGEKKLLGAFEYEHGEKPFEMFKTLGAKRYMTYDHGELELTVAGLGKKEGRDFIMENGETVEDWFEFFNDDMSVPAEKTGKLTHTYIDHEIEGDLTDMFGNTMHIYEKSCIHLEPAPYHLSLSKDFVRFLAGYEEAYGLYGND